MWICRMSRYEPKISFLRVACGSSVGDHSKSVLDTLAPMMFGYSYSGCRSMTTRPVVMVGKTEKPTRRQDDLLCRPSVGTILITQSTGGDDTGRQWTRSTSRSCMTERATGVQTYNGPLRRQRPRATTVPVAYAQCAVRLGGRRWLFRSFTNRPPGARLPHRVTPSTIVFVFVICIIIYCTRRTLLLRGRNGTIVVDWHKLDYNRLDTTMRGDSVRGYSPVIRHYYILLILM